MFRNPADRDYIAARAVWRLRFRDQFLWSSLQAFEKYLKAILLYNGRSARWPDPDAPTKRARGEEYGHSLSRLLAAVRALPDLNVTLPPWTDDFVLRVEMFGANRYLTRQGYSRSDWLARLDESVWSLRRYAQFVRIVVKQDGQEHSLLPVVVAGINDPRHRRRPASFRIVNGELERVLGRPSTDQARRALVWNNLYFGARSRRRVTYSQWSSAVLPMVTTDLASRPEILETLRKYIKLEPSE